MKRLLLLAVVAAGLVAAPAASATEQCRGLEVCVTVRGPWVVVPNAAAPVHWSLTCPKGFTVAGLDARIATRNVDLAFLGSLGAPVAPGVSTKRSVVFVGTSTAGSAPTSFQPVVGCAPLDGGARRGTTGAVADPGFPPIPSSTRRVKTFRLTARAAVLRHGCRANERLVSASHAVGIHGKQPPATDVLRAIVAVRRDSARIEVRVSAPRLPAGVRVEIQVHAVCAKKR